MTGKHLSKKDVLEILDNMGLLGDIRQRLGAKDENDTTFDNDIMEMDAQRLVASHTGWNLGDESWADNIIYNYEELKKAGL